MLVSALFTVFKDTFTGRGIACEMKTETITSPFETTHALSIASNMYGLEVRIYYK